jgi:hypothetical protein
MDILVFDVEGETGKDTAVLGEKTFINDIQNYYNIIVDKINIDNYHFNAFIGWDVDNITRIKLDTTHTNIRSIVIQYIIYQGAVPVIYEIPESHIRMEKIAPIPKFSKKQDEKTFKKLSKQKQLESKESKKSEDNAQSILIQLHNTTPVILEGKKENVYLTWNNSGVISVVKLKFSMQQLMDRINQLYNYSYVKKFDADYGNSTVDTIYNYNLFGDKSTIEATIKENNDKGFLELFDMLKTNFHSLLYFLLPQRQKVHRPILNAYDYSKINTYTSNVILDKLSIELLELFFNVKRDRVNLSPSCILNELIGNNLFIDYFTILHNGKDHPQSKLIYKKIKERLENNKRLSEQYVYFTKASYITSYKNKISLDRFNKSYSKLNKSQLSIIDEEFNNTHKIINNLLEFVNIRKHPLQLMANNLITSIGNMELDNIRKYYDSLNKQLKFEPLIKKISSVSKSNIQQLGAKSYITYKNFPIICVHWLEIAYMIKHTSPKSINYERIITSTHKIMYKYADDNFIEDEGAICQICGAKMLETEQGSELSINQLSYNEIETDENKLLLTITRECFYILNTFVFFKGNVNKKDLANSISKLIYNKIVSIQIELRKNKIDKLTLLDLLAIHIQIYIYASICHLIFTNLSQITFVTKVKQFETPKTALKKGGNENDEDIIVDNKEDEDIIVYNKEDEDIIVDKTNKSNSDEFVVSLDEDKDENIGYFGDDDNVNEAKNCDEDDNTYEIVEEKIGGRKQPTKVKDEVILMNIINSAVDIIKSSKSLILSKIKDYMDIERIKSLMIKAYHTIGQAKMHIMKNTATLTIHNVKQLFKHDVIYRYINLVARKYNTKPETLLGNTIDNIIKHKLHIFNNVKPLSKYDSSSLLDSIYNYYQEYITSGVFNLTCIPRTIQENEFEKKYNFIDEAIKHNIYLRKLKHFTLLNRVKKLFNPMLLTDYRGDVELHKYYCKDGQFHKFNIFVYDKLEITNKEADTNKQFISGTKKLTDRKCSNCGEYASKIKKVDVKSIINEKDELENFYNFYQSRCPEGEIHEFIKDSCKKCKIHIDLLKKKNDKLFFKKYHGIFKKQYEENINQNLSMLIKEINKNKVDLKEKEKEKSKDKVKVKETKAPSWKVDVSKIMLVSKMFDINHNILFNIGLNERLSFSAIELGKESRYVNATEEQILTQCTYLHKYMLWIIKTLYTIRNIKRVIKLPSKLKYELEKMGNITTISSKMPEIAKDYITMYNQLKDNVSSKELANFSLHNICNALLVLENTHKSKILSSFLLNEIIRFEKETSMGVQNISKLYKQSYVRILSGQNEDDEDDEKEQLDDNLDLASQDVGVLNEIIEEKTDIDKAKQSELDDKSDLDEEDDAIDEFSISQNVDADDIEDIEDNLEHPIGEIEMYDEY